MTRNIYSTRKQAIKVKLYIVMLLIASLTVARIAHGQQSDASGQSQGSGNWVTQMNHVADLLNLYADELSQRAKDLRVEASNAPNMEAAAKLCKKADLLDSQAAGKRSEYAKLLLTIGNTNSSLNLAANGK